MGSVVIQPEVSATLVSADALVTNTPQRVLIVGQGVASANYTEKTLQQDVGNDTAANDTKYGKRSHMAAMLRAFKAINTEVSVDAIPLDDAAGAANTWLILPEAGPTTAAGSFYIEVGGAQYSRTVAIPSGTTLAAFSTLLLAELNTTGGVFESCPYIITKATNTLTFTAQNDGTLTNDAGINFVADTPGMTFSVVNSVVGATDPTLTGILSVIGSTRYQTIVWPYSTATTVLTDLLDGRFNSANAVLDGVGVTSFADSEANHTSALSSVNSQSVVYIADEQIIEPALSDFTSPPVTGLTSMFQGPALNEAGYEKAAQFAAIRSLRLTEGANISQYLTSTASLDQTGGPAIASLPYFNTPMPNLPVVKPNRGWTATEIQDLQDIGASIIGSNATNTSALLNEMVTTYLTDSGGNVDVTFTYLNYVDTASGVREFFHNNLKRQFAQSRLTEGTPQRGRDMVNAAMIEAFCVGLYQTLAGPEYALVQDGEDALLFFKRNFVITLNLATGTATIAMSVPIVTQLRVITATIKVAFSTTGS
jgi:phage tail sheath gpL-like